MKVESLEMKGEPIERGLSAFHFQLSALPLIVPHLHALTLLRFGLGLLEKRA